MRAHFEADDWISPEDYLALDHESLDQKYEYVDGHMYALAGGSNNHSYIAGNMFALLREHLLGSPCKAATSDMMFQVAKGRYLYPDVSVSCDKRDTQEIKHFIEYPILVVEVLSPTTEMYDRTKKFRLYQKCLSIQEYILINQYRKEVEIYTRNGMKWEYRLFSEGDDIEITCLNMTIPIDKLYINAILPRQDVN